MAYILNRKSRNYVIELFFRLSLFPEIADLLLGNDIADEIHRYWGHFVSLVKDFYGVDLQTASPQQLAKFWIDQRVVIIRMLDPTKEYTKKQLYGFRYYATKLIEFYAVEILDWLRDWARQGG